MIVAVFAGFQTSLILNLRKSRILQDSEWFSSNSGQYSQNFGGNLWISSHAQQAFSTGFPMSSRGGGGGGGGWLDIFWNNPIE